MWLIIGITELLRDPLNSLKDFFSNVVLPCSRLKLSKPGGKGIGIHPLIHTPARVPITRTISLCEALFLRGSFLLTSAEIRSNCFLHLPKVHRRCNLNFQHFALELYAGKPASSNLFLAIPRARDLQRAGECNTT